MIAAARRILSNTASLLASDVVNRGTTFLLYALVARYLGAFAFGQLSLALTLFYTFQVVAALGLKTLITREVARDPEATAAYLLNGSAVAAAASLLSIAALWLLVWLMGYGRQTAFLILLLSLGLLPFSLSAICEAVFQAWERMHLIAWATVPANLAKAGLAFLALSGGCELYHLVLLVLLTAAATAGLEWHLVRRHITRPRAGLDLGFSLAMVRSTATFLGIDLAIALWSSLPILLLGRLAGEEAVGLYSAAAQLLVPVGLVFQNVEQTLFPLMCRRFDPSFQGLKQVAERVLEFLLILALPISVGLFALAGPVLRCLYGSEEFLAAAPVLGILVWGVVLKALTHALGQVLLAGRRERITLRIVVVNALVSLVLGLLLISRFGPVGAALAALLAGTVNALQHYLPVSGMLRGISLGRLAWKPAVAGACMAAVLAAAKDQGVFLGLAAGAATYAGALLALSVWAAGGPGGFRARYRHLWPGGDPKPEEVLV